MTNDNLTEFMLSRLDRGLTAEEAAELERLRSPEYLAWVEKHRAEIDAATANIRVEDL
ncbi:Uncharacterised protein [Mycobacteroides abscessus subsp. abscessus]|uniref:hypothetical protein n=1 Tax=Mycobacteroides abscessus TaxID=36809 RepID=UPI000927887A|nr:hypothetical protein [Mycobacteroides abscessus]SHP27758.1 Uncharacterised protein [Mycobacteroides abscessus subsp. abscessus]SHP67523.1 Uncharacterised protein [Mycobacteroides abscessus subsp. abscessus]SHY38795.1 Uncharacterised protein [Mycobacteroides abscessus subsp. abscessus]SKD94571.1 Uncharacterised protein [Mycobacteroides abscessus subsp. abscessus]